MSFMQHLAPPKSSPLIDRERLMSVVDPVVRAHGAELVDFEIKNEGGWILRVYVEKLGASAERMSTKQAAVDLDLCAGIARDLSPALDVADPIPAPAVAGLRGTAPIRPGAPPMTCCARSRTGTPTPTCCCPRCSPSAA